MPCKMRRIYSLDGITRLTTISLVQNQISCGRCVSAYFCWPVCLHSKNIPAPYLSFPLSLSSSRDLETAQTGPSSLSATNRMGYRRWSLNLDGGSFPQNTKISGEVPMGSKVNQLARSTAYPRVTISSTWSIFAMTKSKIKRRKARERLSGASKAVLVEAIKQEHHALDGAARLAPESVTGPETSPLTDTHPPHHPDHDPKVQVRLNTSEEAQVASAENVDLSSKPGTGATSKCAPPTDTPTSLNSGPSSSEVAAPGQRRKSPPVLTNQCDVPASPNVGLLKAQSPWLRKEGVCIAVLEDKSVNQSIRSSPLITYSFLSFSDLLGVDVFWPSTAACVGRRSQLFGLRAEAIIKVAWISHPCQFEAACTLPLTT